MSGGNKYSTLIQLGFAVYMIENWIKFKDTPGLLERSQTLFDGIYMIIGKKTRHTNATRLARTPDRRTVLQFVPEILKPIERASKQLSGLYDLNNGLVFGIIQCILINCYDISGIDFRYEIAKVQGAGGGLHRDY